MDNKISYFNSVKEDNTEETFKLVKERLDKSGIDKIVLASTNGDTAKKALIFFRETGVQLVVIPHQYDFSMVDNPFPAELVKELRQA